LTPQKLALFFQIVCRLGLPFSAHSGPFAFELFTFTLPQIGFVFSNSLLLDTDLHRSALLFEPQRAQKPKRNNQ
jgi:hypothetical protein